MEAQLHSPDLYTIAWIALLLIELAAAKSLLDERHEAPEEFNQSESDTNSYTWGRAGAHNIVIASLPAGVTGTVSAATTASNMVSSLPHLRIGLLVGIGGGIPRLDRGRDIRLGDVVISQPDGSTGGVIQYDLGKAGLDGTWERIGSLNMPPLVLLHALASLKSEHEIAPSRVPDFPGGMLTANPRMATPNNNAPGYIHQGIGHDKLFNATSRHDGGDSCDRCDGSCLVERKARGTTDPAFHYGIVIRGISDYADSHKNDRWQRYAAATAVAYAKELVGFIPVRSLQATKRVADVLRSIGEDLNRIQSDTSRTEQAVQSIRTNVLNIDQQTVLARLLIAAGAAFDSHAEENNPTCLPDTRSIFWLNGMAGTGKSTLSRTIAQSLASTNKLGANFFFKRSEGDRGTTSRLFTTIAAQLAARVPDLADYIKEAIEKESTIGDKGLQSQFHTLILGPLSKVLSSSESVETLVLVIDAWDECDVEDRHVKLILDLFSQARTKGLKVFLTSRPELPVRIGFHRVEGEYKHVVLPEIASHVVERDLTVFFSHELTAIRSNYNASVPKGEALPTDWPGNSSIERLVKMASPLFIQAATVCRLLGDQRHGGPDGLLQDILSYKRANQETQLDATYLPILHILFAGLSERRRVQNLERFKSIVASIIILATPLSTKSLSKILSLPRNIIDCQLSLLHSVLSVPQSADAPVKLLHLSFRDFLVDPEQHGQDGFWIDETTAHAKMQENVSLCNFLRDAIEILKTNADVLDKSPLQIYSSVLLFSPQSNTVRQQFILSLPSWISLCPRNESGWGQVSQIFGGETDLCCVVLSHYSTLLASGSDYGIIHIRRVDTGELIHLFRPYNKWASNLCFSHDSKILASQGSDRADICVWSTTTGECTKRIVHSFPKDPEFGVYSFAKGWLAFSNDFKLIAVNIFQHRNKPVLAVFRCYNNAEDAKFFAASSGKDIRVWRIGHSGPRRALTVRGSGYESVALSHDGTLLFAIFRGTLRGWNTAPGEIIAEIFIPELRTDVLTISTDSTVLACCGQDDVYLWHATKGEGIQDVMRQGQQMAVLSHDSSLIISRCGFSDLSVWRTSAFDSGQKLNDATRSFQAIEQSPDSKQIAFYDGSQVQLFRCDTGEFIRNLQGDGCGFDEIAFSRDSSLLAARSMSSKRIWIWSTVTGCPKQVIANRGRLSGPASFSPNSSLIALVVDIARVDIIDIAECELVYALTVTRFYPQSPEPLCDCSAIISSTSAFVAAVFFHGTIMIWCVETGSHIQTLHCDYSPMGIPMVFCRDPSQILYNVSAWRRGVKQVDVLEKFDEFNDPSRFNKPPYKVFSIGRSCILRSGVSVRNEHLVAQLPDGSVCNDIGTLRANSWCSDQGWNFSPDRD
ncbi:hypothetical protein NCS52_01031700 [Fusarium sp. LHS14.1]|nr:hypothetical protein NCS52_01031700 [Fusarium sp. LHS14.1]